ncbi:ubiquinol-cytochrome c reductase subunit 9 [Capronia coronata CBS 617.96]|uniref:Complex III subunit 9 n=1 Tax=Capronia coronata CBS 617.96 TaxID=1182541 RepID=W9YEE3_9EURO|nr:ubiquinol-cytochrome c reductase subunit 9 [Capronia coronata CBS 617.96]EXJ90873.1 ubiquinol-cytochrome c reductase subunit 9 [Capronia coronata CBS 617.96]
MPALARISETVFNTVFRRNAVFLTAVFTGAFFFEIGFDTATNRLWDSWNQGRQWKDIKHRYMTANEDEEE